jgi:hypothetical protein
VAFLTTERARAASPYPSRPSLTETALRKSAAAARETTFDVFLSHSRLDADVIAGVKVLLERRGMTVYVDWIDDPQLDRSRVTPQTADVLRMRMQHSKSLIFATSESSPSSKWMPWELGYFDGSKPGHIAILPLVQSAGSTFVGQEYLGLYPLIEDIAFTYAGQSLGIFTNAARSEASPIEELARRTFMRRS